MRVPSYGSGPCHRATGAPYPLSGALVRRLVAETAVEIRFVDLVGLLRDAEAAFSALRLASRPGGTRHARAVLREALSNAIRHSGANELTVTVSVGDELAIDVADDGSGMSAGAARIGLHNLSGPPRRADVSPVGPRNGKGTRLSWAAPLPPS